MIVIWLFDLATEAQIYIGLIIYLDPTEQNLQLMSQQYHILELSM